MNSTEEVTKQRPGQRLNNAKRLVVISKLADYLTQGYYTTNELATKTGLTRKMIDTYRPMVDEVIGKQKLDRNVIRALQLKRTYQIIEKLIKDLEEIDQAYKPAVGGDDLNAQSHIGSKIKAKTLIYNQIAKFSSHLALITGLNVETHVNVDHQQLVIIRADNSKRPIMEINEEVKE